MYQALYRKYRPQTFSDVVGQKSVTDTLRSPQTQPCVSVYRYARHRQDVLRQDSGQGRQL